MGSNDYIVITGSRNLNDDEENTELHEEEEESSRRALEKQGVFLDRKTVTEDTTESNDEFSKKLKDIGGIEILSGEEGEEY